jgi:ubiquinone/menaquinone biosynthesis C-methylase UbiE
MLKFQKEVRKSLQKYGGLSEVIKKNGVLAIMDFAISNVLYITSKRFYRPSGSNYGLSEAFFRVAIDRFERYARVAKEIQKMDAKTFSVLDVGSAGEGISSQTRLSRKSVVLVDIRKDAFNGLKEKRAIIGDGCRLPLRDDAFDVVVSVDTVEHIPRSVRHSFYEELKRVCKKRLIITCPLQSSDGMFQGEKYDIVYQCLYVHDHGIREPNTAQHIASGHPTLEEINRELPNSTIYGYKNCDVWLKYMVFSGKPIIGSFCGVLYYLFWKKNDHKPPYWGAIITSDS